MKKYLFLLMTMVLLGSCSKDGDSENPNNVNSGEISLETSTQQLILTEQASASIMIYDRPSRKLLWQWTAADSSIPSSRQKWFELPDEARPVFNRSCLLITASKGGLALIRIRDKKVLFYAKPGGNPHSAEVLPNNNIVVASSDGNTLTLYKLDTISGYASSYLQQIPLEAAHNVVWDLKRNCLWSAAKETMYCFDYINDTLTLQNSYPLSAGCGDAHDLTPIYGSDRLYLAAHWYCYIYNPVSNTISKVSTAANLQYVKSISTGPTGFSTICTYPAENTNEEWWTPSVMGFPEGMERIFYLAGYQIYKARWRVETPFSYPAIHKL